MVLGKKERKSWCAWSFSLQVARELPWGWQCKTTGCRWELDALNPNCDIGGTKRCDSMIFGSNSA